MGMIFLVGRYSAMLRALKRATSSLLDSFRPDLCGLFLFLFYIEVLNLFRILLLSLVVGSFPFPPCSVVICFFVDVTTVTAPDKFI